MGKLAVLPRLRPYFPVAAQACLIGSGLVVAFGFPLLFGLKVFGVFVQATALTFVAHRIVDLLSETVLVSRDFKALARTALLAALVIAIIAIPASLSNDSPIQWRLHYPLFVALVASTIALNGVFQTRDAWLQLAYAVVFGTLTFAGTALCWLFSFQDLGLLLTLVNALGAAFGLLLLWRHWSQVPHDAAARVSLPSLALFLPRLGLISFNVLLTYGIAVLEGSRFSSETIANLRLFSSVALLGAVLTPVNAKAYYGLFDEVKDRTALLEKFRPYRAPMTAALALWAGGMVVAWHIFAPKSALFYLIGGALYPAVAYMAVQDKLILKAQGPMRMGALVAGVTLATFCLADVQSTARDYVIVLGCLVALYPVVTASVLARPFLPMATGAAALSLIAIGLVYMAEPPAREAVSWL